MARKLSPGGEYVKKALEEGRLENDAAGFKRRFAKLLYNEKPELFESIEQVRAIIRWHTEAAGPKTRLDRSVISPYNVPKYIYQKAREIAIPTAIQRVGLIGDIHIPFEDRAAIQTAYQHFVDKNIQALILNGDIIDAAEPSRWGVGPSSPTFSYELDALYEFMIYTRDIFPTIPIYFKEGNHDARVKIKLWNKAPELARELDFFEIANLRDFEVTPVNSPDHIIFADLHIYHGHEFRTSSIVYPAKTIWNKTFAQKNILINHLHVTDDFKKANSVSTHVVGCMCDLQATYDVSSDYRWNHGYAYMERYGSTFKLENVRL